MLGNHKRYPIKKITKSKFVNIDKLDIDIVFKAAWISFLNLGKITYKVPNLKKLHFQ